jgi:hypothetical protein
MNGIDAPASASIRKVWGVNNPLSLSLIRYLRTSEQTNGLFKSEFPGFRAFGMYHKAVGVGLVQVLLGMGRRRPSSIRGDASAKFA